MYAQFKHIIIIYDNIMNYEYVHYEILQYETSRFQLISKLISINLLSRTVRYLNKL